MKRHQRNEGTGAGLLISKQAYLKERNKKKSITRYLWKQKWKITASAALRLPQFFLAQLEVLVV